MGKRREYPLLEKIEILDAGTEGKAVARKDNLVVFVPFLVPGDIADIRITRRKKKYFEGKAVRIHRYSPRRVDAVCSHFGLCGGCKWQNMKYEDQLFFKEKQVRENFDRIGTFDFPEILPIIGSPKQFGYRNKLEYTFSNRKWLTGKPGDSQGDVNTNGIGFHIPGMFDRIIDIEKCYLQDDLTNQVRNSVKEYSLAKGLSFHDVKTWEGLLRNLITRNTTLGEWMVIVVFHRETSDNKELLDFIREGFPHLNSLMYCINPKKNADISDLGVMLHSGNDYILEEMPPGNTCTKTLRFKIGPKSFFQTNSLQASNLYHTAVDFAEPGPEDVIYDLYSGTGTISCYAACLAKKVVGIEYVDAAVADARENAALNGIDNAVFVAGDLAKTLNSDFIKLHGQPHTIITDPPRSGMHPAVVEQILQTGPEKVVYVSCNPSTQARDISLMKDSYRVEKVQPIDMFPHTQHVENIVLMVKK